MNNRDIYKDEFGNYHEVEEETENPVDGLEDDLDDLEDLDDSQDPFDSAEDDDDSYDEDEEYANQRRGGEYDVDED